MTLSTLSRSQPMTTPLFFEDNSATIIIDNQLKSDKDISITARIIILTGRIISLGTVNLKGDMIFIFGTLQANNCVVKARSVYCIGKSDENLEKLRLVGFEI